MALNEKYLAADVHYMGVDLKSVGEFAEDKLSLLNERARTHLYGSVLPSLLKREALAPEEEYIQLTEQDSQLKKKLKSAFCEEGNVEFNPVLDIVRSGF